MAPAGNAMTLKRINREIKDLDKEDLGNMTLEPSEDNMFLWKASIPGPEGSPYEGGVFHLKVELAQDYPFSAPKVTFTTRIYHMNVSDRGSICIDILKQNWSPALSLYKVLLSLSSLLTDPNPNDPLVPSIASEYVRNRTKHDSTAREWTRLYAQPPTEQPVAPKGKGKARTTTTTRNEENGRPRRGGRPPRATQSVPNGEVMDLSDEDDRPSTNGANGVATRTRANNASAKRKRGAEQVEEEGGTSRRRRIDADATDDVIVIED